MGKNRQVLGNFKKFKALLSQWYYGVAGLFFPHLWKNLAQWNIVLLLPLKMSSR